VDHEILSTLTSQWIEFFDANGNRIVDEQLNTNKELEQATQYLRAAVTAEPESPAAHEARVRLGRVLYRRGDFGASARELSAEYASTAAQPLKYLSAVFLAMAESEQQHFDRAQELYSEAIRLYPASQAAAIGLSALAYRRGQPAEAATVMTGVLKGLAKNDPWWYYLLGEGWHFEDRLDALRAGVKS
jgi:tetratricopeptide (TPR) repeat protein